jgi:hypothetical protein
MARAGSFEEAFSLASLSKAVYFLERAAAVQREFRPAADALDASLGFKVDRRGDLSSCTVEDLHRHYLQRLELKTIIL